MYVLHYVPDWASICVHLALAEMGVPYRLNLIDADGGGLTQPDHLRRQPFGLIPALDSPAGPIFETGAILLWLSERHGLAPAPGSPERAAFLSWFVFTNQQSIKHTLFKYSSPLPNRNSKADGLHRLAVYPFAS